MGAGTTRDQLLSTELSTFEVEEVTIWSKSVKANTKHAVANLVIPDPECIQNVYSGLSR